MFGQESRKRQKRASLGKKGKVGALTSVVRSELQEVLGPVIGVGGQDDVHATVGGRWVDLNSTLSCGGITTAPCSGIIDSVGLVKVCLDSGRVRIAMRNVVRTWFYRCGELRLGAPAPWNGKGKGRNKGPLGRDPPAAPSDVPLTASDTEPRLVPPRDPPGAGVGPSPSAQEGTAHNEDMIKALKLLQSVMSAEDFSKYEKMVLPSKGGKGEAARARAFSKGAEAELFGGTRAKKQEHNLTQQRLMLQDVQIRLGAVRDEVHALKALVSEKEEPTGPPARPPPPCPREPPPDDDENPGPVQDRMTWLPRRLM